MPKTLLVDTNRAAFPIYKALCDLGHEVWVVGGNPSETLAKYASNYSRLDYSEEGKLDSFIREHNFDYLVPGCTDVSYEVCSTINNGRFPGIEPLANTKSINNKNEFRNIAVQLGIPVPRVLSREEAVDAETVIIKPVDSFSGRGMVTLNRSDYETLNTEYSKACQASKTGQAIVEELVKGQLFSHSAFIISGKVVTDFIVQEDCIASPYAVDTSCVVFNFPSAILYSLRENIQLLAKKLKLIDGLVHTQFILQEDKYWLIEITRRCPGDIYSLLIELSTDFQYAASYLAPFIGESPFKIKTELAKNRIIRHTVSPCSSQKFFGLQFSHPVYVHLFVPLVTSGEALGPGPQGRVGILFFKSNTDEEHENLYQKIINKDLYKFQ